MILYYITWSFDPFFPSACTAWGPIWRDKRNLSLWASFLPSTDKTLAVSLTLSPSNPHMNLVALVWLGIKKTKNILIVETGSTFCTKSERFRELWMVRLGWVLSKCSALALLLTYCETVLCLQDHNYESYYFSLVFISTKNFLTSNLLSWKIRSERSAEC